MEADSLTNLIASAILQNDSSITAFYLDLADSQRLISSGTQVNLEGLDGDIRGFSTYTFSSSILTLYGVVSMVGVSNVIVFRNAETGMNLQGITNLNDTVGDSTIFRSTFQPLPGEIYMYAYRTGYRYGLAVGVVRSLSQFSSKILYSI